MNRGLFIFFHQSFLISVFVNIYRDIKSQEAKLQRLLSLVPCFDLSSLVSSIFFSSDLSPQRLLMTIIEQLEFSNREICSDVSSSLCADSGSKDSTNNECSRRQSRLSKPQRTSIYEDTDDDSKENEASSDQLIGGGFSRTPVAAQLSSESEAFVREPHLKVVQNPSQIAPKSSIGNMKGPRNCDIFANLSFAQAFFECKSCGEDVRPNEILVRVYPIN